MRECVGGYIRVEDHYSIHAHTWHMSYWLIGRATFLVDFQARSRGSHDGEHGDVGMLCHSHLRYGWVVKR